MFEMRLGFIGAGNMATAILDGVVSRGLVSPENIMISNPHTEKLEHPRALGCRITCDNRDVAVFADLIILAVKPQMYEQVLSNLSDCCGRKCIVSIAPGISCDWLRSRLPDCQIIRVMPNTPLKLSVGATAIAQAPGVPAETFQLVCDIFSAAGSVAVLPETQMDAVIPVSGSSPAFFFRMADAMVKWASDQGIDPRAALELTASTMKGSAEMLLRSGVSAAELTRQVCSPGGTTIAALRAFDDHDFEGLLTDAMNRCVRRSKELGK